MFNVSGGATAVARWGTRKYKKHAAYLGWFHKQELRAAGINPDKTEDDDDDTPSWKVVQDDGGGDWESESHTRPMD